MKRLFFSMIAVAIAPGAAMAQDGWGWSIIIPSVAQTDILGTHLRDRQAQQEAQSRRVANPPVTATAPQSTRPNLSILRYVPSKARRDANLAAFVAKSRRADAAGARSLEELFAKEDFIERLGRDLAPHGLRIDDVGDAYAVWWMSAWQATRGLTDTPSPATTRAVQAQAGRALASTPELARAGDAPKQELAEALLIQTALIDAALAQARNDPAQIRAVAAAAAQGARGMGLDLATMELTEAGFVPARRE